jgi:hypothetical protein
MVGMMTFCGARIKYTRLLSFFGMGAWPHPLWLWSFGGLRISINIRYIEGIYMKLWNRYGSFGGKCERPGNVKHMLTLSQGKTSTRRNYIIIRNCTVISNPYYWGKSPSSVGCRWNSVAMSWLDASTKRRVDMVHIAIQRMELGSCHVLASDWTCHVSYLDTLSTTGSLS